MTNREFKIFKAAYYADVETFSALKQGEQIPIKFEQYNKSFEFTLDEIVKMNIDCWKAFKDRTKLNESEVNPKAIYDNSLLCLDILKDRGYDISQKVEYSNRIHLTYELCGEHWFENEFKELTEKGFRLIDLDLIHYGIVKDESKVLELLKAGANPFIHTYEDDPCESDVLDILAGKYSSQFNMVHEFNIGFLRDGIDGTDRSKFKFMLAELYTCASSSYMYDLIDTFCKKHKLMPNP